MNRNTHETNLSPAPDVHVAYADLEGEARQKYEDADQALAELIGPEPEVHDSIFPGANHIHVAYKDLDPATLAKVQAADKALEEAFGQK